MKPRLLITGASGYLGRHLARRAAEDFEVLAGYASRPDRVTAGRPVPLDVTDRAAVFRIIAAARPAVVIHTAAANPGRQTAEMMPVNAGGARHVAGAAQAVGARLIHLSSDVVFDGRRPPYDEAAQPSPVNDYARSKVAGEAAVREAAPGAAIVRTSLIYSLDEIDRSNAGFIERLRRGEVLRLWTDVIRQPVWVETLAAALLELAGPVRDFSGVLNVAGRQALSRWEFGRRMLAFWGAGEFETLQPGLAREEPPVGAVPLDLRLDLRLAERVLVTPLPGVDEVLAGRR